MNHAPEPWRFRLSALQIKTVQVTRRSASCLVAGLAALGPEPLALGGEAQTPPSAITEPAFPEYATVEELLRLDAQAALQAARRAVTNPLDEQRPMRSAPQGNALLAIFGTGRALNAEVQIGSRVYTYRSAMRRAVAGGASPYLLDKIDPPCVHLSQGQQKEVLCLSRVQP